MSHVPQRKARKNGLAVLLVTGSRSLADPGTPIDESAGAKEAFLDAIWSFADEHPDQTVLVVGGEASGPDAWAKSFVHLRTSLSVASRSPCAFEHLQVRCDGAWIRSSVTGETRGRWREGRAHPLDRNTELVAQAKRLAAGGPLHCLAVVHARSRTGGTLDTIRKAREAGFRITTVNV